MYFSFFKLKKWGKKTAETRRRNCAVLPQNPFIRFSPLRLPPCGVSLCMGRSAGKRSVPFQSHTELQLKSLKKFLIGVQYERLLGFQVQGHFVRQAKNALPSSFQKLSRAFCSLSDWKATCKPPVPFDGNEQLAEKSCYHFAIKSAVANQKVVISLGLFCPKYHGFFIPTRCKDTYLNGFCLDNICSCSSENFDSPYYPGYTMDAYQNLISSDKRCDA